MKKKISYTPIDYSNLPTPTEIVEPDGKGGFIVKKKQADRIPLTDNEKWNLYLQASRLNQEGERQQQEENLRNQEALQFLEKLLNNS